MFDKFLRIVRILWMNKLYLVDLDRLSLPLEDPRPIDLDRLEGGAWGPHPCLL